MRQAAEQITDRAKRYRANADAGDMPRVCMFCAATSDLQVDHLDGFEEHGEPENLIILCRSCNQLKSSVFKAAGLGRRTEQYNPGIFSGLFGSRETYRRSGAADPEERRRIKRDLMEERQRKRESDRAAREREIESKRMFREVRQDKERQRKDDIARGRATLREYQDEIRAEKQEAARAERERQAEERADAAAARRRAQDEKGKAVARYKGISIYKRGRMAEDPERPYYASVDPDSWFSSLRDVKQVIDTFKNPASSYSAWSHAVGVLRGEIEGSPRRAAAVVRSTPPGRRLAFLESMKRNPGANTMGAFMNALMISRGDTPGDVAAAAKLLHETSASRRAEFQREIWAIRKDRYGPGGRQDSLPF